METGKKFKLTDEFITLGNRKLYRIEALKDFSNVKKGDKGGFVESEENLSQYKDCWVYDDAKVYGNAKVFWNAEVYDDAKVFSNAEVYDDAKVFRNARIYGNAKVFGNANVYGYAWVFNNAIIYGNAKVYGNAEIYGDAKVCGNANIFDGARVFGSAWVLGEAIVYNNACVHGDAQIKGDAKISNMSDYIIFTNWWSSGRHFTWTKSNNMWKVGCFYGTGEELIAKAYKDSELSGREYKKVVKYVKSILKDSNTTTAFNKIKQCLTKFLEKFKL